MIGERLLKYLPSFWKKELQHASFPVEDDEILSDSPNNRSLMLTIGDELEETYSEVLSIKEVHWVDTSSDIHLNRLGQIFGLTKFSDETDEEFKQRLKSRVPSFIGGGTKDQLIQSLIPYVGEGNFELIDGYKGSEVGESGDGADKYARFKLFVFPIEGVTLEPGKIEDVLNRYKAAGVKVDVFGILLEDTIKIKEKVEREETLNVRQISIGEDEEIYAHRIGITKIGSANKLL